MGMGQIDREGVWPCVWPFVFVRGSQFPQITGTQSQTIKIPVSFSPPALFWFVFWFDGGSTHVPYDVTRPDEKADCTEFN